jgi:hypothetical protein
MMFLLRDRKHALEDYSMSEMDFYVPVFGSAQIGKAAGEDEKTRRPKISGFI